jgi:archaemetzincin
MYACRSKENLRIAIQPYGKVDPAWKDSVRVALKREFNADVTVLPVQSLPANTFINIKSPRYRADKIIRHLREIKPDNIDYILALTDRDISTTKKDVSGNTLSPASKYDDWGVFGLGYRPGPSCIVSTFRIQNTSKTKFFGRLQKISIHEVGHNLGLQHCDTQQCVMRDAVESILTVDAVQPYFCDKCKRKIR